MAILTGTVTTSAVWKPSNSANEKLTIVLEVDCAGTLVDIPDDSKGRPDHTGSRSPANLDGRAVSVTVDNGTLQVTAISIT